METETGREGRHGKCKLGFCLQNDCFVVWWTRLDLTKMFLLILNNFKNICAIYGITVNDRKNTNLNAVESFNEANYPIWNVLS